MAEENRKTIQGKIESFHNNMIQALKAELVKIIIQGYNKSREERGERAQGSEYSTADVQGVGRSAKVEKPQFMGYSRLDELKRHEQRVYNTEDLVDTYFYVTLEGNLSLIRRTLIQDAFKGK